MTLETRPIRERIRNRALFREQRPMKGRELIGYLTLSALILLPAVFGLWQQGDYVRTRLDIEAKRRQTLALREQYRLLRIERATLESLSRVGAEARRYGLVPRDEARSPFYLVPDSAHLLSAGSRPALLPAPAGDGADPFTGREGLHAAPAPSSSGPSPSIQAAGGVPPQ